MSKKVVFFGECGVIIFLLILAYVQSGDICYSRDWCRALWSPMNRLGETLLVSIPMFLFSLITYKMKDEVFQAWWSFARWYVPALIVATFLLNNADTGSGYLNAGASLIFLILFILYAIFVLVSLIKIVCAYRWSKQ